MTSCLGVLLLCVDSQLDILHRCAQLWSSLATTDGRLLESLHVADLQNLQIPESWEAGVTHCRGVVLLACMQASGPGPMNFSAGLACAAHGE